MKAIPINQIICNDNILVIKSWFDNCIDSIITDPPYALEFMGKGWDKVLPSVEVWEECLRVAKPGAFMLCFGGTRTFHRLTCAIEDAGWQIRDCLMWLYGSGFPKSHNISKAIDKASGAKRKVVGSGRSGKAETHKSSYQMSQQKDNTFGGKFDITAPTSNLAKLWDGYGTGLKPAWEPIIVAMKPMDGNFAKNAEKYGVAGLNIDGGRIDFEEGGTAASNPKLRVEGGYKTETGDRIFCQGVLGKKNTMVENVKKGGRWPANLILDEEAGAMLDEQSGERPISGRKNAGVCKNDMKGAAFGDNTRGSIPYYDSGGASRFFYVAKAGKKERGENNNHPTVKPLKLMEYLCRLLKPPSGGVLLDPFCGSGSTLMAAFNTGWDYIGIDKESEYVEIAKKRVSSCKEQRKYQMFA
ncbi:hypothetical protein LCGC14_1242260 [marine sediment metagenome]|uniref:DNA methylase N-4/N-6 domain-containing protein n=1 Tax=marine sediment metagenome TaxID=412755 RepID=A0A0F9NMM3_9ZZZZ